MNVLSFVDDIKYHVRKCHNLCALYSISIVVAICAGDGAVAAMAMSGRFAGRVLRTAAQSWRSLSVSDTGQSHQSRQFALESSELGFRGLRRALGFQGLASGRRLFGASSAARQQSLATPSEVQRELQADPETVARTAELVAHSKEMQVKSIDEARARIFGHVIGNGERSAHKVLRRKMIGQKIVAWYPTPIQKQDPMFEDPKIKRRAIKNERLKRRGKGPPKKGHGKRAAKRAK